jgi:predicted deacetylase
VFSGEGRYLCVSLHDVAPWTWPACARVFAMLETLGRVPVTLLVVPDYHRRGRIDRDPTFLRAIEARLARGDEVALHGYTHLDEGTAIRNPGEWVWRRAYTAGEGEFAALSVDAARQRLDEGLTLMRRLGWPVTGFVAPAWLLGAGARAALTSSSLVYTTTRRSVFHLPSWRETRAPSLVYSVRARWRRAMSRPFNERLFTRLEKGSLVRMSLHPADAAHADVMEHWHTLLERALCDRQPLTKRDWIARDATPVVATGRT